MKQVQFENQLAINSNITLKDIRNLILATRLIIQDQAINDLKTTLPRLGTFKKKLRAAKRKYNINTATVNTISAKNSLYMTRAGFQQQLLEPRYHESYTYKPDRIYPDSELCHLLSTLTNLELKTCKEFVYEFVSTIINIVVEGDKVTIRNLGTFQLGNYTIRPLMPLATYYDATKVIEAKPNKSLYCSLSGNSSYNVISNFYYNQWSIYQTSENMDLTGIAYDPASERYAAVGKFFLNNKAAYSLDGKIFELATMPYTDDWMDVVFANFCSTFIALRAATANECGAYSTDSITWSAAAASHAGNWKRLLICEELGKVIAIGECTLSEEVNRGFAYTDDGSNWQLSTMPEPAIYFASAWSPDLMQMVAFKYDFSVNAVITSNDGINWTQGTCPSSLRVKACAWSPLLLVYAAIGYSSDNYGVMTSPDGYNWTLQQTPVNNEWESIIWATKYKAFVAVGAAGSSAGLLYSRDSITWILGHDTNIRQCIKFRAAKAIKIAIQ